VEYTAPAVFFDAQCGVRCMLNIARRRCYRLPPATARPRAAQRGRVAARNVLWTARRGTGRVG